MSSPSPCIGDAAIPGLSNQNERNWTELVCDVPLFRFNPSSGRFCMKLGQSWPLASGGHGYRKLTVLLVLTMFPCLLKLSLLTVFPQSSGQTW